LPPIVYKVVPLKLMLPQVKAVSSLFGVVDPAPPNTSESPVATGPEPDELVQFAVVLKLVPVPPTQVSVLAANTAGVSSASARARVQGARPVPRGVTGICLVMLVFIRCYDLI